MLWLIAQKTFQFRNVNRLLLPNCSGFMGKSRIKRCQEIETKFRSGTWAKRIYLELLLSSCRAPLTRGARVGLLKADKVIEPSPGLCFTCRIARPGVSSSPVHELSDSHGAKNKVLCFCEGCYSEAKPFSRLFITCSIASLEESLGYNPMSPQNGPGAYFEFFG